MTNRIPVPSYGEHPGHEPFSRCSATIASSTPRSNSACVTPFGQTMRATSIAGARAEAEVHAAAGDRLLLRQQPGPHLDLAADAERVDPLIAGDVGCARGRITCQ